MKYENKTFNVSVGDNEAYRKNWEQIFGKKEKEKPKQKTTKKKKAKKKSK